MTEREGPLAALKSENTANETLTVAELKPAQSENVSNASKSVAIVGGGLAGLAAAAVLAGRGLRVDLFEKSAHLGGRAGSFTEPWNGQLIDQCQHVALGCCKSFLDFCRRTGIEDCFQRHKTLHFIGPDGRQFDVSASAWLPAPLHLLPGLMRLKFLSLQERLSIVRMLTKLLRLKISNDNAQETVGTWLRGQGQSETIIERFWSVVLTGALSETVDFASLAAAKKVFADGFCASRRAYELITPRLPLGEIFNRRLSAWLEQEEVSVHRGVRVMEITSQASNGVTVYLYDGSRQNFDAVILAVPWFEVDSLLFSSLKTPQWQEMLKNIQPSGITAVHLWFDQPITDLPYAALVGKLSQWIFNGTMLLYEHGGAGHGRDNGPHPSPLPKGEGTCEKYLNPGSHPTNLWSAPGEGTCENGAKVRSQYYQVVISASHRLVKCNKDELLKTVLADLNSVLPQARKAELLHARIVDMPSAVFSMQPWMYNHRAGHKTSAANLFLAGDWTDTGWPSTMEGAVRSGYSAAHELLKHLGR
jgi:squalene-associated FAD-dependent desaturase